MQFLSAIAFRLRHNPSEYLLPPTIVLVALVIRLHGLGDKPFWLDEVISLNRATLTLPGLVNDSLSHKHYPSYFLLLWLVGHAGASQWLLRLPSAVFGALAAGLTAAVGRLVGGWRSGIVAGLLMTLSPFEVQLGQEARSYTLASCLILIALWGLVRLARAPTAAAGPWRAPETPRGAWLAYGLGTAAALDVLNVAVPWLLAANLSAAAIAWQAGAARSQWLRRWGLTQALVLVAWAPALIAVFAYSRHNLLKGMSWAPPETAGTIWEIIAPVYLLRIPSFITFDLGPAVVPGLSVAIATLAALGIWRLRHAAATLPVIGAVALALPLGMLLLSEAVPMLVPRYFAWSAAAFFILAGAGLGQLSARHFALPAAALALACVANLAPYYRYETKPRWDLLASALAAEAQPGDVVLLDNFYSYYVLQAFASRSGLATRGLTVTWHRDGAADLATGHNVWAVYGRTGQGALRPPEDYLRSLATEFSPIAEEAIGRYIVLWRMQPRGPAPVT
jgi:hypothetical protein